MRTLICFLTLTLCNLTLGQDPTVPSSQILERLQQHPATVGPSTSSPPDQARSVPPSLKLKAVVMADSEHGIALIEVDGRRVRLRLSPATTERGAAPKSATPPDGDGVVIQGSTYYVQSFSARSILLSNYSDTLLVQ